ncbi:hypothetical protein SISSUDRAFT_1068197 [Sistotremastrum suecicum HHB10207 ss-3]|uniref:Uncharacterized protein n=1 Tax=Sistotremastrum suecicum HHB10207 ss-3 TaxID=1314776 RepID=A0A165WDW2_9AGAM|nr:hypothetical protein SISSUDRAFT_1068197 [Sistotremastrum suecicum HHB10207 ss-3]
MAGSTSTVCKEKRCTKESRLKNEDNTCGSTAEKHGPQMHLSLFDSPLPSLCQCEIGG